MSGHQSRTWSIRSTTPWCSGAVAKRSQYKRPQPMPRKSVAPMREVIRDCKKAAEKEVTLTSVTMAAAVMVQVAALCK